MHGVALAVAMMLGGAPAPLPRSVPAVVACRESALVGEWVLDFYGSKYRAHFDASGSYSAVSGEYVWIGQWRMVDGTLHVVERTDDLCSKGAWSVKLPRDLAEWAKLPGISLRRVSR